MATLPATGTTISMGRTGHAYSNLPTSTPVSIGSTSTVKLGGYIGRVGTATTPFSSVFGGRSTPFSY